MAVATLTRGTTTIDIPLIDESGTPLIATDFGKPELELRPSGGTLSPRSMDNWNANINHNIVGRFTESNAYADAIELADLIKADPSEELILELPTDEYPNQMTVCPAAGNEEALTLSYEPGYTNSVQVELGLTEVERTLGNPTRTATTPTATGTGPVEIEAGGNIVSISSDLQVERSVGRMNDTVNRAPNQDLPNHIAKRKPTFDEITLGFVFAENTVSDLQAIADNIFKTRLGRDGIKLHFNGMFGLGTFDVVPTGSAPFRQTRLAGREGTATVPTFSLRRVHV